MTGSTRIRDATPADARAIAGVHVDSWRTTYRGLLPDEVLAGLDADRMAASRERLLREPPPGHLTLVAEDGGTVVGFAVAGPSRDPVAAGEVYAVYVLASHQRRGLGGALLRGCARRLAAAGLRSLVIWVLRENRSARSFYERLGGVARLEKEDSVFDGTADAPRHPIVETGYVWEDTATLCA